MTEKKKPARKAISKKLRFEVFKRDSFQCQYCGRSAPDVILEADHVQPVKEGGETTILNLITACNDCNRGKGARKLSDQSELHKQRKQLQELNKRREQLKMMIQWRDELSRLEEEKIDYIVKRFESHCKVTVTETGRNTIRTWLKKFSVQEILDAVDTSAHQYLRSVDEKYTNESIGKTFSYIPRICSRVKYFENNPAMKDLYYIRGILRNRMRCNEHVALEMLKFAHSNGAKIEDLKKLATECSSWAQWRKVIEDRYEVF